MDFLFGEVAGCPVVRFDSAAGCCHTLVFKRQEHTENLYFDIRRHLAGVVSI